MKDLKRKAVDSIFWSSVEKFGRRGITFIIIIVLARLLGPDAFGLVAMASIFTSFIQRFIDQGMMEAIIQNESITKEHLDTAFWTNLIFGIIMMIFGILFASTIALLFNEDRLGSIIPLLSINLVLYSFSTVQIALLKRNMNFKALALRSIISQIIGGIIGIIMALKNFGVWSLVGQQISSALVEVVILWKLSDWRPRLLYFSRYFRELFTYGVSILGIKIVDFVDVKFDHFLIGYLLGTTNLGYYAIAIKLIAIIIDFATGILGPVLFSTFSRIQKDMDQMRKIFYQVTYYANIFSFPIFIIILFLTPQIVIYVFGKHWTPSISVMKILALSGIPFVSIGFTGYLAMAMGFPHYHLIVRLLIMFIRCILMSLGIIYGGINGLAISLFIIAYCVYAPINILFAKKLIIIRFQTYLVQFKIPFLSITIMTLFLIINKSMLIINYGSIIDLLLPLLISVTIYLITLMMLDKKIIISFQKLFEN